MPPALQYNRALQIEGSAAVAPELRDKIRAIEDADKDGAVYSSDEERMREEKAASEAAAAKAAKEAREAEEVRGCCCVVFAGVARVGGLWSSGLHGARLTRDVL